MAIIPLQKVEDTGWRNIASLLNVDWYPSDASGFFRIKRQGDRVSLAFRITAVNQGLMVLSTPAGFTPANSYVTVGALSGGVLIGNYGSVDGLALSTSVAPGTRINGEISYTCKQPFPTVLPGTAV